MKFVSSFIKELKIASRGFYFYIELFMAFLILAIFLFVVPDNFNGKSTEYVYLDMPSSLETVYVDTLKKQSVNEEVEVITIEVNDQEKEASMYVLEDRKLIVVDSHDDLIELADKQRKIAVIIHADASLNMTYEYFLQGYESQRLKNLLKVIHVESTQRLEETINNQVVQSLDVAGNTLSDKENILPSVLVFNGSLMGLFIMAAYIFLDRQEGVIKAYAITPSPVWHYLLSKVSVLMVTSIVSTFIIIVPIMGFKPDYGLLMLLLVTTGFFASTLGLLLASFYKNIMQAFGALYLIIMVMIVPNIAYFMPTWNPSFIEWIPSYPMLMGFKSILLGNNDWALIGLISGVFLLTGLLLFVFANHRYKKILVG